MNRCHTKGRENSRELCVLLPLPGERAGVRASVSSNLIFGVGVLIPSRVTWFVGTLIPSLQFVENTCKRWRPQESGFPIANLVLHKFSHATP